MPYSTYDPGAGLPTLPTNGGPPTNYNPGFGGGPTSGPAGAPSSSAAAAAPVAAKSAAGYPGPSIFGTGMFEPIVNPINTSAITDSSQLNDLYARLQGATNGLQVQNYSATAPQGTAATGSAAQGSASSYQAPQGSASGYSAALGGASNIGRVAGSAALGGAAYADPTRISTAGDLAWQSQQQGLANILARQAAGGGMSPADIQLRQGEQDQIAGNLAVLGSQRGSSNFALAQRSASDDRARAAAILNQQMGLQRANETIQAQQALGNVLGTARGQAQNYNVNQADLLQQQRLANAGFTQGMTLADMNAANAMTEQNMGLAQQANEFNAGNAQQMTLADMEATNAASQYNAGNSQQMTLQNLLARGQALQSNAQMGQQMTLADLVATNQFGMANLENEQQTNVQNLGLQGQYGLANQQMQYAAQQQYQQTFQALIGAGVGVAEANRQAQLAAQQLITQQNTAQNQIAAEAFASAAQANENLTGGVIGAISSVLGSVSNPAGNAASAPTTYPLAGGGTTTDPTNPDIYTDSPTGSLSDENVKTGISGGNPMLDSFLRQYQEARGKPDEPIDPESGLGFHVQRYSQALSGGAPGSGIGRQIGGAVGGIAGGAALGSVVPGIGTAIGALIGGLLGGAAGGAADSSGSPGTVSSRLTTPATGLQQIDVTGDEDPYGTRELSDENEKEAVMSGNKGLQAFLQQANAQQSAQANQGGYSNAFMQQGGPLQPQPNTQMPPQNPNAGYGQTSLQDLLSFGSGGGGMQMGGYEGGGFAPGGMTDQGGFSPAGITAPGSYQVGGITSGGGGSPGGTTFPMPNLATTPIGASAPWGANPLLRPLPRGTGVLSGAAMPINGPTPSTGPAALAITPGGPGWGGATFAPGATPGLAATGIAPNTPSTGYSPVSSFQAPRLSDEREKTDIEDDPQQMRAFLDALHAHSYRYKDPEAPGAGEGRYVSPMAQELEQTDLGRNFVFKGPTGSKMINYGKLAGTQLAATAMMHERVSRLEDLLREETNA